MSRALAKTTPRHGVQIRTEPTCKICNSPHRAEIEDVLSLCSKKELMPDGTRPTHRWIIANSEAMWGLVLNPSNLHSHFKKHFRLGAVQAIIEDNEKAVAESLREAMEKRGVERIQAETFLETIIAIGYQKALANPDSVTLDQALKAVGELTKRRHDETTATLMSELAKATNAAIKRVPIPTGADGSDEVIEAEVVDEPGG